MVNGLSCLKGKVFLDTADSSNVEERQFAYSINMGLEGEGIVKDNIQISSRGCGIDFHIANLGGDVRSSLQKF